jgi:hypothetical protein
MGNPASPCGISRPLSLTLYNLCGAKVMAARPATTVLTAAQNQYTLPTTSFRGRLSRRAAQPPYNRGAVAKPLSGRWQHLQAPSINAASKLQAAYTSLRDQPTIALPVHQDECITRLRSYCYATLYPKGSHSVRRIQAATEGDGLTAQKIHHAVWVGRQWNAILTLFDSIVKEIGKWSPNFRPHGLMFLLRNGYW